MPPSLANDPRTIMFLGLCQKLAGKTNEARDTFMRAVAAMKPTPDAVVPVDARQLPCYLAWAYAGLGEKDKALEQARQAVADYANDALSKPFAEGNLAIIQAQFGDIDSAIAALPHLLEVPNGETPGDLRSVRAGTRSATIRVSKNSAKKNRTEADSSRAEMNASRRTRVARTRE